MARRTRIGPIDGLFLLGILIAGMTVWGALAIHYSDLANSTLRHGLTATFALAGVAVIIALTLRRLRWKGPAGRARLRSAGAATCWQEPDRTSGGS